MGAPLLAMIIAVSDLNLTNIARMVHGLVAFFFGWAHGYTFNEWGGYAGDVHDPFKTQRPLLTHELSRREILVFSIILACIGVALYCLLNPMLLPIVFLSLCIGVLYNHPRITLKKVRFASFFVLFIISIDDTLLGWLLFSHLVYQGVLIGLFFGVLGCAGICYHETGDYESDRIAGIQTNAVRFGKRKLFYLGFVFYTVACLYFITLTVFSIVPGMLYLGFLITYPGYAYLVYQCIRGGLEASAVHRFITRYRILYGMIGLYMMIMLLV
jgi:4-hydroxybenzoate polyprenyltransferase